MADEGEPSSKRLRSGKSISSVDHSISEQCVIPQNKLNDPTHSNSTLDDDEDDEQPIERDSLLVLNDDCLRKILECSELEHLCDLADVCKRFKSLAEDVFGRRFNKLRSFDLEDSRSLFRRVLRKFGHLITEYLLLSFFLFGHTSTSRRNREFRSRTTSKDVHAIAEFCPKLIQLYIIDRKIICDVFKSLFAQLIKLILIECEFIGDTNEMYAACTNLVELHINPKKEVDIPVCKFQKLKILSINNSINKEFNVWTPLLEQNPQITTLCISGAFNDEVISNIIQHTNGIEILKIRTFDKLVYTESLEGLLKLVNLKSLKQLSLHLSNEEYRKFAGSLADALAVKQIAISDLCLRQFKISSEDLKSISGLKTLQHLELDRIGELTDKDIALIAKELPLLKHLRLETDWNGKYAISTAGLVNVIRLAEKLSYFEFRFIHNVNINLKTFESLVEVIKKRGNGGLKMTIWGCKSSTVFSVPESIQQANRSTLEIKFVSWRCSIH